jgi:hypothetical protein
MRISSIINALSRLLRTLWYLKPSQFFYRARKLLLFRFSKLIAANYIKKFSLLKLESKPIINPLKTLELNNSYHGRDRGQWLFEFVGDKAFVDDNWQARGVSYLWSFNLHYFDFLFSEQGAKEGLELISSWIDTVPAGDRLAWHPYPISRRISNWVAYFSAKEDQPDDKHLLSLRAQIETLKDFIEWDILGNHLIANAEALIVGGCFFRDKPTINLGLTILKNQLPEQILVDGGHYERSPMYHCLVLQDLLSADLALKQSSIEPPEILSKSIRAMTIFLSKIKEADSFPLLNDSAKEIALTSDKLLQFTLEQGLVSPEDLKTQQGLNYLQETGLVVLRDSNLDFTFDIGPLGPDFLLGHAHNDSLSIALNLNGESILTDSGVYEYQGKYRNYFRSASAHNVYMLKDIEPNQIWSSFRVGHRGYPAEISIDPDRQLASASHTSYDYLGVSIKRAVEVIPNGIIWIDRLECTKPRIFEGNLHFHPDLDIQSAAHLGDFKIFNILKNGIKIASLVADLGYRPEILLSPYSDVFGWVEDRINLKEEVLVSSALTRRFGIFSLHEVDGFEERITELEKVFLS